MQWNNNVYLCIFNLGWPFHMEVIMSHSLLPKLYHIPYIVHYCWPGLWSIYCTTNGIWCYLGRNCGFFDQLQAVQSDLFKCDSQPNLTQWPSQDWLTLSDALSLWLALSLSPFLPPSPVLQQYVVSIDGRNPLIKWEIERGLDRTISSVAGESYRVDVSLSFFLL